MWRRHSSELHKGLQGKGTSIAEPASVISRRYVGKEAGSKSNSQPACIHRRFANTLQTLVLQQVLFELAAFCGTLRPEECVRICQLARVTHVLWFIKPPEKCVSRSSLVGGGERGGPERDYAMLV